VLCTYSPNDLFSVCIPRCPCSSQISRTNRASQIQIYWPNCDLATLCGVAAECRQCGRPFRLHIQGGSYVGSTNLMGYVSRFQEKWSWDPKNGVRKGTPTGPMQKEVKQNYWGGTLSFTIGRKWNRDLFQGHNIISSSKRAMCLDNRANFWTSIIYPWRWRQHFTPNILY
jgi:hypothetical protein